MNARVDQLDPNWSARFSERYAATFPGAMGSVCQTPRDTFPGALRWTSLTRTEVDLNTRALTAGSTVTVVANSQGNGRAWGYLSGP